MRALLIIALALGAGACSRSDADHLQRDVRNVGADVGTSIRHVGDDPHLRQAGAELHVALHQADTGLHHVADDTHHAATDAGDHLKDASARARQDHQDDAGRSDR